MKSPIIKSEKKIYTAIVAQSYPPTKTTALRPMLELILKTILT